MTRPTTKSYAGRQVDIEALKHVEKMLQIQRVLPDVNTNPRIVSGIEKAVQRYAKLFLTHVGTVKLDPDVGSTIVRSALTGQISNLTYLSHLYSIANISARNAIAADDESEDFGPIPDDERIVDTELVDLDLDYATSTVKVHVKIITASGDDYTFIIPVQSGVTM